MDLDVLLADLRDARRRLLFLVEDLDDAELRVPQLEIVNPILWEIGHVAWFQERWMLRELDRRASLRADADELYDSAAVEHDTRWELPLPSRASTLDYMQSVLDAAADELAKHAHDERRTYFARLVTFHEDMHGEALVYTRRTLGHRSLRLQPTRVPGGGPLPGDVDVPGGTFRLGTERSTSFVFDNELDQHAVSVAPFRIARAAVTQGEFARFVDDDGYQRAELWSDAGWSWRSSGERQQPNHWRRDGSSWTWRHSDHHVPIAEHAAMLHVNWFEAEAWCNWAGRRLPTEVVWEVAACGVPDERGGLAATKRCYPWGDEPPTPERAHLDLRGDATCDVGAFPAGDSAFGCRQMLGNAWEWCADDFAPFPGFRAGPYREYSEPWFSGHKVLRGGCYATRSRLVRGAFRNFYPPHRRDVLAGFRTCARRA